MLEISRNPIDKTVLNNKTQKLKRGIFTQKDVFNIYMNALTTEKDGK